MLLIEQTICIFLFGRSVFDHNNSFLLASNPHDRHTWRSGVKSAMRAASQLSGRGPTDMDVAPVPAR